MLNLRRNVPVLQVHSYIVKLITLGDSPFENNCEYETFSYDSRGANHRRLFDSCYMLFAQ